MPLAARMRPRTFDEYMGQAHLVGANAAFRRAAEADKLGSVLLWGPPGVGKTTLAEIVATTTRSHFERLSAVSAGVQEIRRVVDEAKRRRQSQRRTTLFIDEIHRFNKSQQDAVLPVVENGTVTLIGATTENPSFEVNAALLSRCRVFVLHPLSDEDIRSVLDQALADPVRGLASEEVSIAEDAMEALVILANGDARSALNMLELSASVAATRGPGTIDLETLKSTVQRRTLLFDKGGEQHYDLISALHKTVRGSDVDASLYWLARLLESGEDPMFVARRVVRMASEDIGLADPQALSLAMAAQQALHFIGMPEGCLALAQAVAYLAAAPKSNAIYVGYKAAVTDVQESRNDPVPLHLRNAPTKMMKELGYGEGYKYAHDFDRGIVGQQNLPERLLDRRYFIPTDRGFEAKLNERINMIRQMNQAKPTE
ncbi:MAG: replication-associated recombination protein A [Fimbriimonas sp.]